jgi:hypothetical protein
MFFAIMTFCHFAKPAYQTGGRHFKNQVTAILLSVTF